MGYVCGYRQQPSEQHHMGTAVRTAKTSPASWDAFSDVEAFVDEVLMELESMAADGTRPTRSGPPLTGAALRKAIMAIWCVGFCGMQWRAIGLLLRDNQNRSPSDNLLYIRWWSSVGRAS